MSPKSVHTEAPQFGQSVFVCSKPIQVFHCSSIVRDYQILDATIFIYTKGIEDSENFKRFFEKSGFSELFKECIWLVTAREVANQLRFKNFDSLFVEDDRVSFYSLFAPLKTKWMILFEEGIGTYRGHYQFTMNRLRRLKWKFKSRVSGCGFEFGSGRRTDYIMVQKPDLFRKLNRRLSDKVLPFPGLINEIGCEPDTWHHLISNTLNVEVREQDRICLILGTWGGAPGLESFIFPELYDHLIFKSHPHDGAGTVGAARRISHSWVPAEVFVDYLAKRCGQLDVIHYSSSVAFYMKGRHANTHFYDLDSSSYLGDLLNQL